MTIMAKDGFSLSDKDYEQKSFKTAPGGVYRAKITAKSQLKPGKGGGTNLNVHATITKGPHKGITFFDNIASHVGWKIAQLLHAVGKKLKKGSMRQLLKLVTGQDVRVQLREETYNGKEQNKVVTWLPLTATTDDEAEDDADEDEDEDEDEDTDATDETADDDEDEDENEDDDESDDEDESDDDDDDDDDEEDDDEDDDDAEDTEEDEDEEDEPAPRPKKSAKVRGKKPVAKKKSKKSRR